MRAFWAVAAAGLAGLAGCEPAAGPAGSAAGGVELADVTVAGLEAAVHEKKGSVVVVDFWATWCRPCVESFPHLVELHNKYAGQGLACMSVSVDDPMDKDKARGFLARQRATFPNFLVTDRYTAEGRQRLALRFRFGPAIPHMAVFGRAGDLIFAGVSGQLAPGQFEELINREVNRKPPEGR